MRRRQHPVHLKDLDWYKFVRRYFWDDETTPYLVPVTKLHRGQAKHEIFAYVLFVSILYGAVMLLTMGGTRPTRTRSAPRCIPFVVVSSALTFGVTRHPFAACACVLAPAGGLVFSLSFRRAPRSRGVGPGPPRRVLPGVAAVFHAAHAHRQALLGDASAPTPEVNGATRPRCARPTTVKARSSGGWWPASEPGGRATGSRSRQSADAPRWPTCSSETAGTPSGRCSRGGCCSVCTSSSPRAWRWTTRRPTAAARTSGSAPTTRATSTISAAGAISSSTPTTTSGTSTPTTTRGFRTTRRSKGGTVTTGRSGRTTSPRTSGRIGRSSRSSARCTWRRSGPRPTRPERPRGRSESRRNPDFRPSSSPKRGLGGRTWRGPGRPGRVLAGAGGAREADRRFHPNEVVPYAPGSMSDPEWQKGYARLESLGLSFDLQAPFWHLPEARALAERFPGITIILDHCGLPNIRSPEGLAAWRKCMQTLAEAPNTAVKISGLGEPRLPRWSVRTHRDVVLETIDIFGVDRCMFGSNYPVDRLYAPYGRSCGASHAMTNRFSLAERRQMFYDNAIRWYRIDPKSLAEPPSPARGRVRGKAGRGCPARMTTAGKTSDAFVHRINRRIFYAGCSSRWAFSSSSRAARGSRTRSGCSLPTSRTTSASATPRSRSPTGSPPSPPPSGCRTRAGTSIDAGRAACSR